MAAAASTYPQIAQMTTQSSEFVNINGRNIEYRNTNRLVGAAGWEIGLSKTGYTEEAGKCLIMRITAAGKHATLVLLNANASSARIMDALNIRRFMSGEEAPLARVRQRAAPRLMATRSAPIIKAGLRTRVKATRAGKPAPQLRRRRA